MLMIRLFECVHNGAEMCVNNHPLIKPFGDQFDEVQPFAFQGEVKLEVSDILIVITRNGCAAFLTIET